MRSASQLLHVTQGSPKDPESGPLPGGTACRVCGAPAERGRPVHRWDGRARLSAAGIRCMTSRFICEPCVLVCAWTDGQLAMPVPGIVCKPGAARPATWRTYSVFYEDGVVTVVSKAEKKFMRDWLARPKRGPWFAGITDSGQKHTVPWTPVNPDNAQRPRIFFEERPVDVPSSPMLEALAQLMTAGSSEAEIGEGRYRSITVRQCGAQRIEEFEAAWGRHRGSANWDIALWLAQCDPTEKVRRDDERIERAKRKAKRNPRAAKGVEG